METNTWTTDNRWSPGSTGVEVPTTSPAVYAARWIDCGYAAPADILPDRQGFAYNDEADMHRLIELLSDKGRALRIPETYDLGLDTVEVINFGTQWSVAFRRAGGYIYVEAWLS